MNEIGKKIENRSRKENETNSKLEKNGKTEINRKMRENKPNQISLKKIFVFKLKGETQNETNQIKIERRLAFFFFSFPRQKKLKFHLNPPKRNSRD